MKQVKQCAYACVCFCVYVRVCVCVCMYVRICVHVAIRGRKFWQHSKIPHVTDVELTSYVTEEEIKHAVVAAHVGYLPYFIS